MQDVFTRMLKVYIFSYAIINELCIYYIINFLFFQERGEALGQPTAYLLLLGVGYLLPSHVRANNCFIFQSTSDLDTVSWSTSPHRVHPSEILTAFVVK